MNIFRIKKQLELEIPYQNLIFLLRIKKQFGMEIPMKIVFLRIKKQWEVEISSKSMIFLRIKKSNTMGSGNLLSKAMIYDFRLHKK